MQKNIIILIIKKKVLFCGLPPTLTVLDPEEDQTLQPGTDTTTKTFIFFKDFKLLAKFV